MLDESESNLIKERAIAEYPNEGVWLVTSTGVKKVANIAEDKTKHFLVSDSDYLFAVQNGLKAVIHSHPDWYQCPSKADMQQQLSTNVVWGILSTDGVSATDIEWFGLDEVDKLIGRGFVHGKNDCYGLIRDYYKLEHNIELPEYPRDWEWWNNGDNLYSDGFSSAGFYQIPSSKAKEGDVWLAQVRSNVINHGGILLSGGLTLHHPGSKKPIDKTSLSRREPVVRWTPYIVMWLRHKDMK